MGLSRDNLRLLRRLRFRSDIFKIIGIGYIVELTASSVKDLGFESIADKLVMCGRILIFLMAVPILKSLYDVIVSLIGLV